MAWDGVLQFIKNGHLRTQAICPKEDVPGTFLDVNGRSLRMKMTINYRFSQP